MSVRIDRSRLDRRLANLKIIVQGLPRKVVAGIALQVEREMKIEAPVDTGRLRNSIEADIGTNSATVGTSVNYAEAVARGTRPHRIEPKNKAALAWPGGPHPAKVVNHPGTKANPFDLRAAAKVKADAQEIAEEIVAVEISRA